jgi:histidinol-phosphate aminotransferase
VVVSQYCFAIYPIVTHLFGANLSTVPAKNFGHDLPAMLKAVTPNTKIMFVANPNNPTGTLAARDEVFQIVNGVPDDLLLVLDEAYIDFVGESVDLLPLIRDGSKPNLLLIANVFENLRSGRPATRLWHRTSRVDCRAGKGPAAV